MASFLKLLRSFLSFVLFFLNQYQAFSSNAPFIYNLWRFRLDMLPVLCSLTEPVTNKDGQYKDENLLSD